MIITALVTLRFSEQVTPDEHGEIMKKILDALVHEVDAGCGIAPEDSESYTKEINVTLLGSGSAYFKWEKSGG